MNGKLIRNDVSYEIIGCAIRVHSELGPGLFESAYEACMAEEFCAAGLHFEQQMEVPLIYRGKTLETAYRLDFLVEGQVVVEVKAVKRWEGVHFAQVLTYMKLTNCRFGLLINFDVPMLRDGIKRFILSSCLR